MFQAQNLLTVNWNDIFSKEMHQQVAFEFDLSLQLQIIDQWQDPTDSF